jgi:hypothetical protein
VSRPNIAEEIDAYSRTWRIIDRYVEARLAALRSDLESQQSETNTAATRGAIHELRAFQTACRPAPKTETTPAMTNSPGPLAY